MQHALNLKNAFFQQVYTSSFNYPSNVVHFTTYFPYRVLKLIVECVKFVVFINNNQQNNNNNTNKNTNTCTNNVTDTRQWAWSLVWSPGQTVSWSPRTGTCPCHWTPRLEWPAPGRNCCWSSYVALAGPDGAMTHAASDYTHQQSCHQHSLPRRNRNRRHYGYCPSVSLSVSCAGS